MLGGIPVLDTTAGWCSALASCLKNCHCQIAQSYLTARKNKHNNQPVGWQWHHGGIINGLCCGIGGGISIAVALVAACGIKHHSLAWTVVLGVISSAIV